MSKLSKLLKAQFIVLLNMFCLAWMLYKSQDDKRGVDPMRGREEEGRKAR